MQKFSKAMGLIDTGVEEGIFPGAVACVGDKNGIIEEKYAGFKALYPQKEAMEIDTLFDLASLTKVVATMPMLMVLLQDGDVSLYDLVGDYVNAFKSDKELRIINLLTHTSGFEPFSSLLYKRYKTYDEAIRYISEAQRYFPVGKGVAYSDYNYIVLKAIIEKVADGQFDVLCKERVFDPLNMKDTTFEPKDKKRAAATDYETTTKSYLRGIVQDENARYFDGISGHAGLFSTLHDMSNYCQMYLNDGKTPDGRILFSKSTIQCIIHNYTKGIGEGRGLGFNINDYENSSAGELMTEGAFGHTGFTGTSMWIDKKVGIYYLLLTNRIHPDRSNTKIIKFRRHFHNAAVFEADQYIEELKNN